MMFARTLAVPLLACGLLQAQEAAIGEIEKVYEATFTAMRQARTKLDIEKMVEAIDVPEWQGHLPSGGILTRPDATASLMGLLAVSPESRPVPRLQVLYAAATSWNVSVLYWIYRENGDQLVGSLARDTWASTPRGWRRIRHEKLFPERPLVQKGKNMILPTQP